MKTVIITGANGNLGTACVKKFLKDGYTVIAVDGQDTHLAFAAGNPSFTFHKVNLGDETAAGNFITALYTKARTGVCGTDAGGRLCSR